MYWERDRGSFFNFNQHYHISGQGMPLFSATYINKVDKKGRVSVPAAFRSALPGDDPSISILPSLVSRAIEGFDHLYLNQISERVNSYEILTISNLPADPASEIVSRSQTMTYDGDGRIVLPPNFIEHAGITDRAVFVGMGRTFRIWSPEEYEASRSQSGRT